jgi:hypothetical protein
VSGVRGSAPAGVYVPVLKRVSHGSMRIVFAPMRISQPLFPHQRSTMPEPPAAEAAGGAPARIAAAAALAPNSPRLLNPLSIPDTRPRPAPRCPRSGRPPIDR